MKEDKEIEEKEEEKGQKNIEVTINKKRGGKK